MSRSVIWKFPVPVQAEFTRELPAGPFEVLHVDLQRGVPCLWVKVSADPNAEKCKHRFYLVGTGHEFNDEGLEHVGTFQPQDGLVFHLFSGGLG